MCVKLASLDLLIDKIVSATDQRTCLLVSNPIVSGTKKIFIGTTFLFPFLFVCVCLCIYVCFLTLSANDLASQPFCCWPIFFISLLKLYFTFELCFTFQLSLTSQHWNSNFMHQFLWNMCIWKNTEKTCPLISCLKELYCLDKLYNYISHIIYWS